MEPLDLSAAPPRKPRAELAGITFLPRSIDKARAFLPGGNPGPYVLAGFTTFMFDHLGLTQDGFCTAVASAESDDDVVSYVLAKTTPEQIAAWQTFIMARRPRNGDRVSALEVYPWLSERPDLILGIDVLEEDDARYFAAL